MVFAMLLALLVGLFGLFIWTICVAAKDDDRPEHISQRDWQRINVRRDRW